MSEFHVRVCTETKKQCNPAKSPQCLCWWESTGTADFKKRFHTNAIPDEPTSVLIRMPLLQRGDFLIITRAEHGGYIVEANQKQAAFGTVTELLDWLRHVLMRWQPITELIPPVPRKLDP